MDLPGTTGSNVRCGDVTLHVQQGGEGVPLVLLHGWPQDASIWRHLVEDLIADGHRVIAPDLRGYGRSEAPEPTRGAYRKDTMAGDVLALLDALDIDGPVRLLTHDWGAFVGWILALDHPGRVRSLHALDIGPPIVNGRDARTLASFAAFAFYQYAVATPVLGERLHRQGGFVRGVLEHGTDSAFRWVEADREYYVRLLQEPARAAAASGTYRDFLTREVPQLLRATYTRNRALPPGLPAVVQFGASSLVTRILGTAAADGLVGCEVEVLPGVGHFVPEEAPAEVLRAHRLLRSREAS